MVSLPTGSRGESSRRRGRIRGLLVPALVLPAERSVFRRGFGLPRRAPDGGGSASGPTSTVRPVPPLREVPGSRGTPHVLDRSTGWADGAPSRETLPPALHAPPRVQGDPGPPDPPGSHHRMCLDAALGAPGLLRQSPHAPHHYRGGDGEADAGQEHERHERGEGEGCTEQPHRREDAPSRPVDTCSERYPGLSASSKAIDFAAASV